MKNQATLPDIPASRNTLLIASNIESAANLKVSTSGQPNHQRQSKTFPAPVALKPSAQNLNATRTNYRKGSESNNFYNIKQRASSGKKRLKQVESDVESFFEQQQKRFQHLLDFAIVGFAKCGTTTLGRWLQQHPQAQIFHEENYNMRQFNRMIVDLRNLAQNVTNATAYRFGYRCPHDVQIESVMKDLSTVFPKTKLIVSVRHPVVWFESFYNCKEKVSYHSERENNCLIIALCIILSLLYSP
jgi:hypothetical protein